MSAVTVKVIMSYGICTLKMWVYNLEERNRKVGPHLWADKPEYWARHVWDNTGLFLPQLPVYWGQWTGSLVTYQINRANTLRIMGKRKARINPMVLD